MISADILGNIYKQFLGKIIRMTKGHRAVVEKKPEVKKAGGVYYTPAYIVGYIVKNTVGKLCDGKSPKEISALRILIPPAGKDGDHDNGGCQIQYDAGRRPSIS